MKKKVISVFLLSASMSVVAFAGGNAASNNTMNSSSSTVESSAVQSSAMQSTVQTRDHFDGFYIGANAGYNKFSKFYAGTTNNNEKPSGVDLSVFAGYGVYVGDQIYLGGEFTYGSSNEDAKYRIPGSANDSFDNVEVNAKNFASLGIVLGYHLKQNWLPFVTLGVAQIKTETKLTAIAPSITPNFSASSTHNGTFLGIGVRYMIGDNFGVRAELDMTKYKRDNATQVKPEANQLKVGVSYYF